MKSNDNIFVIVESIIRKAIIISVENITRFDISSFVSSLFPFDGIRVVNIIFSNRNVDPKRAKNKQSNVCLFTCKHATSLYYKR